MRQIFLLFSAFCALTALGCETQSAPLAGPATPEIPDEPDTPDTPAPLDTLGSTDGGSEQAIEPCDAPALLARECGACHGSQSPSADLDLVSAGLRERLFAASASPSALCDGEVLVDPDVPEASLLHAKLVDPPPCGSTMPLGRATLSDADIACVLDFVAAQP